MPDLPDQIKDLQQAIALYGDMHAYRQLYELLFRSLHRFSFAIVKSAEAAEELVSDAFLKIWEIRGRLMEVENLKVYLFVITKHLSLNYLSSRNRQPLIPLAEVEVDALIDCRGPEELCISADLLAKIQEAIRCLPPQCRLIFQLVKEDGFRYKEVAEVLGISILTVRNQVAIASKKIGDILPGYLRKHIYFPDRFSSS
jgi:RNA polymerase sigma-70 factor (ECF subfamily)